jgi:hypothetical protein
MGCLTSWAATVAGTPAGARRWWGPGHSAATSLLALADLQQQAPGTRVVWAVRSATPRPLVGKGSAEADELPARGRLATDLAALAGDPAGAARRDPGPPGGGPVRQQPGPARQDRPPAGRIGGWVVGRGGSGRQRPGGTGNAKWPIPTMDRLASC